MLETLAALDIRLFHFINGDLANPVTDFIMPILTSDWNLRIAYAIMMILILWKGPKEQRWLVLGSVGTLALTDLISSTILKPLLDRPRPCHVLESVHLLVNCGAGLSMPSSHAANSFGQCLYWGRECGQWRWPLAILAFLIAVSRVFVGVHYPGDVVVGGIIGGLVGISCFVIVRGLVSRKSRITQNG